MMKVLPLGIGGAFTQRFFHNNFIIEIDNHKLLIDAGTSLRYSLPAANLHVDDIDYVCITHVHFDHFGGLEELLLKRYWRLANNVHTPLKVNLLMHEDQAFTINALLEPSLSNQNMSLKDFSHQTMVSKNLPVVVGPFQIDYIDTTDLHIDGMTSFALKVSDYKNNKNIVYSSDIRNLATSNILNYIDRDTVAVFQDISFTPNNAHATLTEALSFYPVEIHPILYGMHYNDDFEKYKNEIQHAGIKLAKQGEILSF